jgi:hypothetical protein
MAEMDEQDMNAFVQMLKDVHKSEAAMIRESRILADGYLGCLLVSKAVLLMQSSWNIKCLNEFLATHSL